MSILPKDTSNIIQGVSTYGLWEYVSYLDTTFYSMWIYCAESLGMGMGFGLLASSLFTRTLFTPFIIYSQMVGVKMKLLQPDQEEMMANMKRYSQQGVSCLEFNTYLEQRSSQNRERKDKVHEKKSRYLPYDLNVQHLLDARPSRLHFYDQQTLVQL